MPPIFSHSCTQQIRMYPPASGNAVCVKHMYTSSEQLQDSGE